MTILCEVVPCTAPALLICELCERQLCAGCYGAGSSSRCQRCFEENTAPAPAMAADEFGSAAPARSAAFGGAGGGWGSTFPGNSNPTSEGPENDLRPLDTPA